MPAPQTTRRNIEQTAIISTVSRDDVFVMPKHNNAQES